MCLQLGHGTAWWLWPCEDASVVSIVDDANVSELVNAFVDTERLELGVLEFTALVCETEVERRAPTLPGLVVEDAFRRIPFFFEFKFI